jgi:hypothetical protein
LVEVGSRPAYPGAEPFTGADAPGNAGGMGYVIAAVIVLLLVAGFVTFFVLSATRRSGPAGASAPSAEGHPTGIAAPDESPLGDTTQHSDATHTEGRPESDGGEPRPRVGDPGPEAAATRSDEPADRSR